MYLIDKIITTKNKNIILTITETGKVVLKVPKNTPQATIDRVVKGKQTWILKRKEEKSGKVKNFEKYLSKENLLLYGETLKINFSSDIKKIIRTNTDIFLPNKCKENLEYYIKKYLKELSYEIIKHRLSYFEKLIKIKCNNFSISSARKKWGSCNNKKELKFNFRLIMLKPELIDYVIIHELCHIREFNHSIKFWKLVEDYDPKFKIHKAMLKENSILTSIF